jgi:1-acyl-sn-glycerol-3-phosphate acyltransferase
MWILLTRNKVTNLYHHPSICFWLQNKTKYMNLVISPFFLAIGNFQNYSLFIFFNLAFWRKFVMKKIVGSKHFAMDLILL